KALKGQQITVHAINIQIEVAVDVGEGQMQIKAQANKLKVRQPRTLTNRITRLRQRIDLRRHDGVGQLLAELRLSYDKLRTGQQAAKSHVRVGVKGNAETVVVHRRHRIVVHQMHRQNTGATGSIRHHLHNVESQLLRTNRTAHHRVHNAQARRRQLPS